jgi:two-component system, NarL family, response regulator LiaR
MSMPIKIVLVDDHALIRQGIRNYLELEPDFTVVGEANNGKDAIRVAAQYQPDVMLVDIIMPDMNGVEVTKGVREVSPTSQIIILTSYHEDNYVLPALRAGAQSYVLKDIDLPSLKDTVYRTFRGEKVLDPIVVNRVVKAIHARKLDTIDPFAELTEREVEILQLIAFGNANTDIAGKLVISEKTVKSHVSNILSKLQRTDRTQLAALAWQEGLVSQRKYFSN